MSQILASPPDPKSFALQVWALARQVPPGKVVTYGQLAAWMLPPPGVTAEDYKVSGSRWVGVAMSRCPGDVPWQRVVNAQGRISLPKEHGGERQRQMLEAEGIIFDSRERIDLKHFGWSGPGTGADS